MMPALRPRATSKDAGASAAYFCALVDTIGPGSRRRIDLSRGEIGEAFSLMRKDCEDAGLFAGYERADDGSFLIPESAISETV